MEPLPSSIYLDTSPKAPSPPVEFADFNQFDTDFESDSEICYFALSDDQPEARRSSPFEEEGHTVMEPEFLTVNWQARGFPVYENEYEIPTKEWDEESSSIPCYTYQQ